MMRQRTEYRVERWWGDWCVADHPPSKLNGDQLPLPLSVHKLRWQAWREAVQLAKLNCGDAVLREKFYTLEEQGFG